MNMATENRPGLEAQNDHSGQVRRSTVDNLVYSNAALQMKRGLTPVRVALRNEPTDRFAISLNHALKHFSISGLLLAFSPNSQGRASSGHEYPFGI
jgi:hypothetical protein